MHTRTIGLLFGDLSTSTSHSHRAGLGRLGHSTRDPRFGTTPKAIFYTVLSIFVLCSDEITVFLRSMSVTFGAIVRFHRNKEDISVEARVGKEY